MTSALEKFAQAIDRQFVKEFPELPEKIQARFQRAVDDLNAALAKLP
jgi:ABC-type Zn uptake system ZnuABC Zn-binding protein ZnuA